MGSYSRPPTAGFCKCKTCCCDGYNPGWDGVGHKNKSSSSAQRLLQKWWLASALLVANIGVAHCISNRQKNQTFMGSHYFLSPLLHTTEAWEGHKKEYFLPRGIFSRPRGIFFAAGNIFSAAGNIFCRGEYFLGRGEYILSRGIFSRPRGILLHSFPRGIFSGPRGIFFAAGNIFSAAGTNATFHFRGEYLISAGNIWFRG